MRILGGSLGIAASSAILGGKTRRDLTGASALSPEALSHLASGPGAVDEEQWALIRRVYTDALKEDMIVCCAVLGAAMVVTLGVYRRGRLSMQETMAQRHREEAQRRRSAATEAAESERKAMSESEGSGLIIMTI